jgi:hypothetical protein
MMGWVVFEGKFGLLEAEDTLADERRSGRSKPALRKSFYFLNR